MFDGICASSRSSRSGTRSSCRSETFSSMEVLSPEQETNYMAEDLSDEEEDSEPNPPQQDDSNIVSARNLKEDSEVSKTSTNGKTNESAISPDLPEKEIDPELQKAIESMNKYDRILRKKMKYEKEVKLQGILYQKQMIEEMTSKPTRTEILANTNKYLALMPASDQLNSMIAQIENSDGIVPIFPTQLSGEYNYDSGSDSTTSVKNSTESYGKESREKSKCNAAAHEQTEDFIKRNIEIAKDAASQVPMTDDQKKRLNELLSDLDGLELDSNEDPSTRICAIVGEGYTPDENESKRLADIDQRIEALISGQDFETIQNTDSYTLGKYSEHVQANLPRLSDEQLQRLLADCAIESSRLSSRILASARTLSDSSLSHDSISFGSLSHVDIAEEESDEELDSSYSVNSIVRPLSRETLDRLLKEARSCLGIKINTMQTFEEENEEGNNENHNETPPSQFEEKLFQKVPQHNARNSSTILSADINVEEFQEGNLIA